MNHRIWIINQFANTPDVPGHTRQYEMGIFLLKQGCQVNIFASDYNLGKREYLKLKFPQFCRQDEINGLEWNWLYATPYKVNNWQRIVNMLSFCLNLFFIGLVKPKPDLIIGSSPQILAAFTAWILAKIRGAKFYFEVRDLWPQALIELGGKSPDSLQVRLLGWIERLLYRKSDRVLVIVAGWVNYVQERGASQVSWLPNGPDIEQFQVTISPEEAKAQYQIDSDKFCLMYAGAHGTCNALETIVEAAHLLEQSHPDKFVIVLVGDGPEKTKLMEQGGNLKNLQFRPPIPKTEIPKLLQAADGLILTLKALPMFEYGVSPNKLYDYYAASKPVLVSVGGGINKEIQENQIGFTCVPEDAEGLVNAIVTLADIPPSERNAMGKRAEALVASTYSRKIVAEKLWNLIQEDL